MPKKKIKDLTLKEAVVICENRKNCDYCPLDVNMKSYRMCLRTLVSVYQWNNISETIKNKEIEVQEND